MARYGFYGVYGRNGGGVYTDWGRYLQSHPYIPGVKVKKFRSRPEAVSYIIEGLVNDYQICKADEIRVNMLYEKTNFYLRESELIEYKWSSQ